MFQKELTLIKQVNQKNVCFVIISILKVCVINFYAVSVMACELKKNSIIGIFYGVLVEMKLLIG